MKEKVDFERTIVVTIKNDQFKFDIADLEVGKFIAIEAEKQRLSSNEYHKIATTYFSDSLNAANLIDMIAIFRVLSPDIEKSITTESFEKLNIIDTKDLLRAYIKEIAPWYRFWMKKFNAPFEDDEVTENEE